MPDGEGGDRGDPPHDDDCGGDPDDDDPFALHLACRRGDLDRARYLVQVLHHPVNRPDDFDATPLYLAALCGHAGVCEFLLQSGARCEEGSGDAARVFYVALTPQLRGLLRAWSVSASAELALDPFVEALRGMCGNPERSDCVWRLADGTGLHLHKVLVRQLCPRLLDFDRDAEEDDDDDRAASLPRLETKCPGKATRLRRGEPAAAAALLLAEYLYTGACELRGCDLDPAKRVADLADRLELDELSREIRQSLAERNYGEGYDMDEGAPASSTSPRRKDGSRRRRKANPGGFSCSIQHDVKAKLAPLAELVTCDLGKEVDFSDLALTWSLRRRAAGDGPATERTWRVHAAVLAAHSEYFSGAVRGGFREAETATVDMSRLAPTDAVVDLALQWMYCGSFLPLRGKEGELLESSSAGAVTVELAASVVEFAAAILCPRLGHYAAHEVLVPALEEEDGPGDVFAALELARAHGLERLEDRCARAIAHNLPDLAPSDGLQRALRDEIRQTAQGGDVRVVDVPLAAEIRRHLHNISSSGTAEGAGAKGETTKAGGGAAPRDSSCGIESRVDTTALLDLLDGALARAIVAEEIHQKQQGRGAAGVMAGH
jgi:hypothetical protein